MGILRQLGSTPRALTVAYSMLTDDQVNSRVSKIRERPMKRYTRPLIILRDLQWLLLLVSCLILEWVLQIRKLFRQ